MHSCYEAATLFLSGFDVFHKVAEDDTYVSLRRYAGQTSATKICGNELDSSLLKLASCKDAGSGSATPFGRPHLTSQGEHSPETLRGKGGEADQETLGAMT